LRRDGPLIAVLIERNGVNAGRRREWPMGAAFHDSRAACVLNIFELLLFFAAGFRVWLIVLSSDPHTFRRTMDPTQASRRRAPGRRRARFGPTLTVLFGFLTGATAVVTHTASTLDVQSSWIGNTYGFGDGAWTQINITAIAVAPDGTVYTNAPWDESGAEASVYKDGKVLGVAGGTHGWGNSGGNAIAINGRYVFIATSVNNENGRLVGQGIWPSAGHSWFGITRRERADPKHGAPFERPVNATDPRARLAASFLMVNDVRGDASAEITGLAASDSTLYAANPARNRIEVYDAQSLQGKSSWPAHDAAHLALDRDGTLWVLTDARSGTPHIAHYTANGQHLDDTLPLPDDTVATGNPLAHGWGWWVDSNGDVWRARNAQGIYRLRFGELDQSGNPIYRYADMTAYPVPPPFSDVRRAIYEPATDSLYVTGYTPQAGVDARYWKEAGRVLACYDKWSTGKPVQRYTIALPWQTGTQPGATVIGVTVEGAYVFAVEPVGTVQVYDKASGSEVGVIKPGAEVGRTSGFVDVVNGVSAVRRSNGEYLVFVEEDARGKVMMYRWKPV
jgi:hypothetical protein